MEKWSITPNDLASLGLQFNSATGQISGTPTVTVLFARTYRVTARNSGGADTVSMSIGAVNAEGVCARPRRYGVTGHDPQRFRAQVHPWQRRSRCRPSTAPRPSASRLLCWVRLSPLYSRTEDG